MNRLKKKVEGRLGASVVAVLALLEDLFYLNLLIAVLLLGVVVIPTASGVNDDTNDDLRFGWTNESGLGCGDAVLEESNSSVLYQMSLDYKTNITNEIQLSTNWQMFLEFIQGEGFLERTLLFIGFYPALTYETRYKVSLAYVSAMVSVYFVSVLFVCSRFSTWIRKFTGGSAESMEYSKILFFNWDFNISEKQYAKVSKKLIINEFKVAFDDDLFKERKAMASSSEKRKLLGIRVLVNLFVFAVIAASWTAIFFVTILTMDKANSFIYEYAPTLTITVIDYVVPVLFTLISPYEEYSEKVRLLLVLFRSIFIRLTSLGVLIITQLTRINETRCWETKLGQQMYSLLVFGFLTEIFVCLCVNTLRKYFSRFKSISKFATLSFHVPDHVMDIVQTQAVCWLGTVHSPLLPLLTVVMLLVTFLLKSYTALYTCSPANRLFRSSKSSSVYTLALVIALLMSIIPAGLYLGQYLKPSLECSPFRGQEYVWQTIIFYICTENNSTLRDILFFLDEPLLFLVLFIVLFFLLLYYASEAALQRALISKTKKKIVQASKDKVFLKRQLEILEEKKRF